MSGQVPDAPLEAVLELHRDLYPLADVESAAAAFAAVAEVEVIPGEPRHRVRIRPRAGADPELLRHELANYVLAVAATRQGD